MSYIGNEPVISAIRTVTEATATAGQTVFNPAGGYTVGYLDVFVNGVQLNSDDFTATNGSSVTLVSACAAGDSVRLVAWGVVNATNISVSSISATGTPSSTTYLRGDGSWQSISGGGFSGATVNSSSSSALTLTNTSTQYQVVQITSAANSIVNLPNATTMSTKGFAPFVIENLSPIGANLSIRNASGTTVGYIPVGYVGLVSLVDNSTSAGSWDVERVQPQTFFNWDTASYSNNTQTGDIYLGMIGLSATTFVRFRSSNTSGNFTIYSQACTISGSTITFGSTVSFTIGSFVNSHQFRGVQVIRLSDTAYVIKTGVAWADANDGWGAAHNFRTCTVSGTTITQGSPSNGGLPQTAGGNSSFSTARNGIITRLSDTTFALVYNTAVNESFAVPYGYSGSLACQIISVSGTTQTVGTAVNLGTSTYTQPTSIVALSSTSLFVAYGQSASAGATTGRTKLNVVSISGTTPTWGTSVTIESADTRAFLNSFAMVNSAVAPSATQVIFNIGYGVAEASISGTTPTYNSTPSDSIISPLYLATSTKAYGTNGEYLNILAGGFVKTTNGINTIQTVTVPTNVTPQAPLGAQPTTSYVGVFSQGTGTTDNFVMLGNTL